MVLDQIMSYGIEVLYVSKYQLRWCYLLCSLTLLYIIFMFVFLFIQSLWFQAIHESL
jgi:hypothetical protein